MLKAVAKAANTLKVANMIVEVLIDLLFANTKSTMIAVVVAFDCVVDIVMESFEVCCAAAEP